MGMSLIQKGPGFPFFAPCVYEYFSGNDMCLINVKQEEVPLEITTMLQRVRSKFSTANSLFEFIALMFFVDYICRV